MRKTALWNLVWILAGLGLCRAENGGEAAIHQRIILNQKQPSLSITTTATSNHTLWGYLAADSTQLIVQMSQGKAHRTFKTTPGGPFTLTELQFKATATGTITITITNNNPQKPTGCVLHLWRARPSQIALENRDTAAGDDLPRSSADAARQHKKAKKWSAHGAPAAALICGYRAGRMAFDKGNHHLAAQYWQESLDTSHHPVSFALRARFLTSMADWEAPAGYFSEALAHLEEARTLYQALGMSRQSAGCHFSSGNVFTIVGEIHLARDHYQKAAAAYRRLGLMKFALTVDAELAWLLHREGRHVEALTRYRHIWREAEKNQWTLWFIGIWDRIGTVLKHLKRYQEAEAAYKRILSALPTSQKDPGAHAVVHGNLADLYLDWNRLDLARQAAQRGLALIPSDQLLETQATLYRHLSKVSYRKGRFQQALSHAKQAVSRLDQLRARSSPNPPSFAVFQAGFEMVEDCLAVYDALRRSEPRSNHAQTALEFWENTRAAGLHQRLKEGARPTVVAADKETQATAPPIPHREKFAMATPLEAFTVAKFRHNILDDDSVALFYMLGEKQSYLWTLTRRTLVMQQLPPRNRLEHYVKIYLTMLSQPGPFGDLSRGTLAEKLSQLLLPELQAKMQGKRLLIFPDGLLFELPFATLPPPYPTDPKATYLIEHHPITVIPSAQTIHHLRQRRHNTMASPLAEKTLVFADPVYNDQDPRLPQTRLTKAHQTSLPRLPGTQQEFADLASFVPSTHFQGFQGFAANRHQLMTLDLAAYRLIHLAVHGRYRPDAPEQSSVVLSQRNAVGQPINGTLKVEDLRGLRFKADLIVLSACRTGQGRFYQGEGVTGFARSFLTAGANGFIGSSWDSHDGATATLFRYFYEGLFGEGLAIDVALQRAQCRLLAHPHFREPYFWAPFTFCGDWDIFFR